MLITLTNPCALNEICIFENNKSTNVFKWFFKNTKMDVVDKLTYLGITFNLPVNFKLACIRQRKANIHCIIYFHLFSGILVKNVFI